MRCPSCGFDNLEGMEFCTECGGRLQQSCSRCRFVNPPQAKFCGKCGTALTVRPKGKKTKGGKAKRGSGVRTSRAPASYTPPHLAERIRVELAAMEARGATGGERKLVTHLFSDLKGSTALIGGLDPEEARALVDPALQLMMDAVHRYEGYVAQVPGDGIFALFGAPIAHEDHPQRALYAALLMQEEMRRYSDRLREQGHPPLLMRIGVNTGEVVVRSIHKEDLHTDYVPVGRSTNIAARMEQLAAPGSILVSEQTHKLTQGYFEFKALGKAQAKGIEESLNVYEVLGAGPLRTRLQVAARRGLTRFVGRHTEMEQMRRTLEQAKAGHGQIVGVMGEPGVGKSRLFHEFVGAIHESPLLVLQAFSVSYGKASPYLPIIELLKSYFRIESQDDERTRREKVTGKVLNLDRSLEDTLPYLFTLLGIEEQPSPLQQIDSQIRRRRTFEALKKLFLRESLKQPLILIFEDLHWIDSETQGFLATFSEGVASARILLLTNYRPEYRSEWGQKTYYTQLRLAPFDRAEAEEFLSALLGEYGSPLPGWERTRERVIQDDLHALKRLILDKTQGTPFFMEEIVQELREQGVLPGVETRRSASLPTDLHIPPTVQGVLAARIDRLAPDEKALLQQLAVIGREFPLSLVKQVVSQPEDELYRLLSSLQHKEFLYEQPAFPESEYIFKHALTQEVAYGTVLQDRRRALHERTAQAIERLYNTKLEDHYSELAYHYSRSGNTQKAVHYLHLAGQQAVQRSANMEAVTHFTAALELLQTLADTPERAQQELTLQLALAPPLRATKGLTAPEAGAVSSRALELCRQVGETPLLFGALANTLPFHLIRAELQTTRELAERLMSLAQRTQDPALLLDAHWNLAMVSYSLGEWIAARAHFEQAIALYDPGRRRAAMARVGLDFGVPSLPYLANVLWALGYPDQARTQSRAGLSLAQETAHPDTTALAWLPDIRLYQFLREARTVQQRAEALIMLCDEQELVVSPWGIVAQGWALSMQGKAEEGIKQIQQGMAALRAAGAEFLRPYHLALLAEAYGKAGQVENGLTALAEALAAVDSTGERVYEAELYRLKETLTLESQVASHKSKVEEAEECFLKAIAIAQKQQAKSLELRATVSLARLWQQQGKKDEARQMLAEIYNWFTEGFDTKDLQEAKVLLAELA